MRVTRIVAVAIALASGSASTSTHAQAPSFQRTVLQRADLSIAGHEGVMAKGQIGLGAATGRHTHPGEEISYVLEGTITLEVEGKRPATLKAGDVFLIEAGRVHEAKNVGASQATVVATYVIEKGKPLTTPAP